MLNGYAIPMAIAAVLAIIPAKVAESKGRSFWLWWLYGWMVLIIAIPHALLLRSRLEPVALDPVPDPSPRVDMMKCPNCGESVRADSPVCVFCRSQLNS